MSESPLELVRRVTHERHEQVEDLTRKLGVLSSVATFTRHLTVLLEHHARERQRLSKHADLLPLIEQRVNELSHDIVQLGGVLPALTSTLDQNWLSYPQAVGVSYVIEGSRLGAFAIAKVLTKNGIATQGLQSVGGDLQAIRGRFSATVQRINALPPQEAEVMAAAAERCFDDLLGAYTSWFNEQPRSN